MAYVFMAYIATAYIIMACICIVMAYTAMAYTYTSNAKRARMHVCMHASMHIWTRDKSGRS